MKWYSIRSTSCEMSHGFCVYLWTLQIITHMFYLWYPQLCLYQLVFSIIWLFTNVLHSPIWAARNVLHLSIYAWVDFYLNKTEISLMKGSTLAIFLLISLKTDSVVGPLELSSHAGKSILTPPENIIVIIIIIVVDNCFLCEYCGDTRRGITLTSRYVDTYQPTCLTNRVVSIVQATKFGQIQFQVIPYQWDHRDKINSCDSKCQSRYFFPTRNSRSWSKFP